MLSLGYKCATNIDHSDDGASWKHWYIVGCEIHGPQRTDHCVVSPPTGSQAFASVNQERSRLPRRPGASFILLSAAHDQLSERLAHANHEPRCCQSLSPE